MADQSESKGQEQQRGSEQEQSKSFIGAVLGKLGAAYNAVMRGGEVQAFGRQGIDELGQALRAFPDSIQAHAEPGAVFEPLHSDIEQAREQYTPRADLPSPGEIARGTNFRESERGQSYTRGQDQDKSQGKEQASIEVAEVTPSPGFAQSVLDRQGGTTDSTGGYAKALERSLADEQKAARDKDLGRGR